MREVDVSAELSSLRPAPASPKRRTPLPCRALDPAPGRVSRASLVLDLSCVPLPPRSRALLTGDARGLGAVDGAIVRWAHARLLSLVGTLLTGDVRVAAYRLDASALTGLGPGLTPTGDDLLVGLAAMARRLVGGGLLEARAAVALGATLAGVAGPETTPTSRDLLEKAAAGRFPVVLADFVEAVGSPNAEAGRLRNVTERLASTGAHSGSDLLAGALALVHGVVDQEIG